MPAAEQLKDMQAGCSFSPEVETLSLKAVVALATAPGPAPLMLTFLFVACIPLATRFCPVDKGAEPMTEGTYRLSFWPR